jgi:hypothetical protein
MFVPLSIPAAIGSWFRWMDWRVCQYRRQSGLLPAEWDAILPSVLPGRQTSMKYLGMIALAALLPQVAAGAQDSAPIPNPITSLIKQQVVRYGQWQVAGAEAMPAEKYGYRSTPDTRTFAQLILHVAQFNNVVCSKVSGMTAPDIKDLKDTDSKEKLVAAVKGSFDFCTTALSGLDDSTLGQSVGKLGPNTMSRGGALMILGEDWFDHYSTMAIYLRVNGIMPPSAMGGMGRM